MRKQYHLKPSGNGFYAWDVDELIKKSKDFPVVKKKLLDLKDFDQPFWYQNNDIPTCRSIVEHMKLIQKTSLQYPIILSAEGSVMDGMHRIGKAYLKGLEYIDSVQFSETPKPDHINIDPDELPYD